VENDEAVDNVQGSDTTGAEKSSHAGSQKKQKLKTFNSSSICDIKQNTIYRKWLLFKGSHFL
jgi:hypothetical protein